MNSDILKLVPQDLIKSIVTAIFAAVVVAIADVVSQPGFDVFATDWGALFQLVVNVSISTLVADIGRRFMTDSSGKLFGKI